MKYKALSLILMSGMLFTGLPWQSTFTVSADETTTDAAYETSETNDSQEQSNPDEEGEEGTEADTASEMQSSENADEDESAEVNEEDENPSMDTTTDDEVDEEDAELSSEYDHQLGITDGEMVDSVIDTDLTALENVAGEDTALLSQTIKAFVTGKTKYFMGDTSAIEDSLHSQADQQFNVLKNYMAKDEDIQEILPAIVVESASKEGNVYSVRVTETDSVRTSIVSAMSYPYTINIEMDGNSAYVTSLSGAEDIEGYIHSDSKGEAETDEDDSEEGDIEGGQADEYNANGDGNYDLSALVAYSDKWAKSYNPEYTYSSGNDCANFSSQTLYAGGMPKNSTWYPYSGAWNYTPTMANYFMGKFSYDWTSCSSQNVQTGDIVFCDWGKSGDRDGAVGTTKGLDHTVICVGHNDAGVPLINSHTNYAYHQRLDWYGAAKILVVHTGTLFSSSGQTTERTAKTGTKSNPLTGGTWVNNGYQYYIGTSYYGVGWVKDGSGMYYMDSDGKLVTGWKKIDNDTYYFYTVADEKANSAHDKGRMATGTVTIDGKSYTFASTGELKSGTAPDTGETPFPGRTAKTGTKSSPLTTGSWVNSGWNYFIGSSYYGVGWVKDGSGLYYMDSKGKLVTGWGYVDGKWYYFYTASDEKANSAHDKGRMAKNTWITISGSTYYLNGEGVMLTGWQLISGKWYFFNHSGAVQTGWQYLSWSGGKNWFLFNSSGAMLTGWQYTGGRWYYMDPSSGAMKTGWITLSGKKYYLYTAADATADSSRKEGEMAKGTQTINGVTYTFGSDGALIE